MGDSLGGNGEGVCLVLLTGAVVHLDKMNLLDKKSWGKSPPAPGAISPRVPQDLLHPLWGRPHPRILERQPQFSSLWLVPHLLSSPVCAPWWAGISDIPSLPKVPGSLRTPPCLSLGNTSNLRV